MLLMLSGIVTEVSFEQLENALSPILVTPLGIVIDVSPEQLLNADLLMLLTLSGIVMSPSQFFPSISMCPAIINGLSACLSFSHCVP